MQSADCCTKLIRSPPTPTTLDDFRATWHAGPNLLTNLRGTQTGVGGMIDGLEDRDWEPIPTFYAAALPAGTVTESAYKVLKAEMCARTQAALPLDGVLLHLHGAMVSETTLDAETDITEAIRTIVGPNVPIVVELDMHGNISPALAEQADILLGYDTTPHMDLRAKGMEAVAVLEGLLTSRLRPTTAVRNIPCLLAPQVTDTSDLPLRAVFDKVRAMKADSRVVAVSVFGGFAYADTPWTGASVFVHTNDTPGLARELAAELEETLMDHRSAAVFQALPPGEAVREALGTPDGPVILVDSADNIGGGTPGGRHRRPEGHAGRRCAGRHGGDRRSGGGASLPASRRGFQRHHIHWRQDRRISRFPNYGDRHRQDTLRRADPM